MKSSQKLLNTQMDEAEHLVLVQSSLLFKDLCEHSWVHWGCSDIDATLCQVGFIEDQVAFLQLIKSQFSQRLDHLPALWTPVWICLSSSIILDVLHFGLNHQEVDVHLSQGLGQLSSLSGLQHLLQNCSSDPAEDRDVAHDVEASWCLDVGDDCCWSASHLWTSSWSTPPSVGRWTLWPLSPCQHTQEGSDWLLQVVWLSRGEQREAVSPWWGLSAAHPLRWTL